MSAPELLTARERQLLAAVRELLDIPQPADYHGRQRYEDELGTRAAWLCGYLSGDLSQGPSVTTMLAAVHKHAARPLPYEPEPGNDQAKPAQKVGQGQ